MKRELSMVEEQLLDDYYRGLRNIDIYSERISSYPKGCISKKNIRGCETYYLQWREGDKVKSKYINRKNLDEVRSMIESRRAGEKNIRSIKEDLRRIERFLGKELIQSYANEFRNTI